MRRTKERLLSLLLALVMVVGLLPGRAWAVGETPTAYVTISVEGALKTKQLAVPLTDQDEAGELTINDAMIAAHDAAYDGGAASGYGYYTGSYGLSMGKLWGDSSGAFGYWKNNSSCLSLADTVNGGDYITAFVYQDKQYYSDMYSYFDIQQKTAVVGGNMSLTLYRVAYDENYNTVPTAVSEAEVTINGSAHSITDENGQVTLTFDTPGTYVVSAGKTIPTTAYDYVSGNTVSVDAVLVPPVCTVTVLSQEDYADYETQLVLDQARSALTWDSIKGSNTYSYAVTSNLTIPSELAVDGETVTVSWSCDDATGALSVSNYNSLWSAYVDRPAAQDVSCTLTAALAYGDATATREFAITIKAEGVDEDKETVVTYDELLPGIASGYTPSTDPWVVLEMAAYNGANVKADGGYGDASAAAIALANAAIKEEVGADTLDEVSIDGEYAIYAIPYLSLAYQAAGISNQERMAAMKTAMVSYLSSLETNYAGVDATAPILAALAPYYKKGESNLDRAMDAAVVWLSKQQNSDGTFSNYGTSNANSTALAVVALSALGIDAHTDSRFIKNDKSAMDGLFSFALADHSGFGYKGNVTKNALATEQGFRALVAYARFKANDTAYNIYLQAKDSTDVVPAPDITATKPSGDGGSEGGTASYQITVSVMAPPEGGADGQYTYRHDSAKYTNLLGSTQWVSVDGDTTALEVLTDVLEASGISYVVNGSYVTAIGDLAELDHGPNSGWQYMVDGTAPAESAGTYTFDSDADMVWYYTDDYTKEKDSDAWNEKEEKPSDAEVTENKDGTYTVTLPADSDGPVRVAIPNVKEGQIVVIVGKDGSQKVVKKSVVRDGSAYLLLEADATLRVVDCVSDFSDVASGDWYASAVDFVTSRGLFSGVTENAFAPDMTLNRGMLVTVLYALEEPGKQTDKKKFDDVADHVWYAQGVAWAVDAGIVSGYGNGLFGPEEPITREQLALMLYQYAKTQGISTDAKAGMSGFRDQGAVSSWAEDAVAWAVDAGIISGRPDGTLDPSGTATRAEAAVMLRQLVTLMLA